jgi:hypothetical protein
VAAKLCVKREEPLMQVQPKLFDSESIAVDADATPARQSTGPATIASMTGSAATAVGSPALALQQQLVKRMAYILNGSGDDSAVDEPAKWSMPVSLAVIVGASAVLWLGIGMIVSQVI